jgi:hypothetical protein
MTLFFYIILVAGKKYQSPAPPGYRTIGLLVFENSV